MGTKVKIKNSTISESDLNTIVDSGNVEEKENNVGSGNTKTKMVDNTDNSTTDNSRIRMKKSTDLAQNENSLMDNYKGGLA